ncbi:MAG: tRNA (N(6)-L-threonylcarbamoyladenosine(37)-C(2))-methylthiotransferase MtaB [Nitrospiraceae bacterium]|nr:tRNA (N(6)-L-threonylcarbamoyladenosine(37)-C(2))-methylthiotransferase MtaB [Nitrospiraceae bacterium]
MKVSILTLGCRVNQSESAVIEGTLKQNGVTIVNLNEQPEYCIVNTCTVTARSDYNSRQLIRRAAKAGAKVIVTGCYSQLRKDEARGLPGVFKVIDNRRKLDVISELTSDKAATIYDYYSRSRPYLKVQDGCNFRCSYCSVPLARGKSVSVPEETVIERARIIESAGYHEVVLTGIHLGSYGHDLPGNASLKKLLRRLLNDTSIRRIRLSSLEISEIDDDMIDIISDVRICRHLHLPLQSGSERVLQRMNRRYTLRTFSNMVERIAGKVDNIALGSDVIAGFPGETEEDFADTLTFVRHLPFSYLHIFPFSPRPGTDAASMPDRPDARTVKKRIERLAEINKSKRLEYMTRQLNKTLDIIAEEDDGEDCLGTSGNYLKIRALRAAGKRGSLVFVRPVAIIDGILEAILI